METKQSNGYTTKQLNEINASIGSLYSDEEAERIVLGFLRATKGLDCYEIPADAQNARVSIGSNKFARLYKQVQNEA